MNLKEKFIEKAIKKHGDKYSYHHVEYINAKTPVLITCPKHGDFLQTPDKHLQGRGCRKCADEITSDRMKMSYDEFIEKAKKVHGIKYDYSKVEYVDSQTKICIICPEHGEFWQTPSSHLSGCGCKECSNKKENKYTTETFINDVKKVHGDKYDYSKVEYNGCNEYVTVICPTHGEFKIRARHLINGTGCKKCSIEKRRKERLSDSEQFIEKAKEVHGDKYDYSKVNYVNSKTKVCIVCPEHGEFWQTPNDHLSNKHGCRKCGNNLSKVENEICEVIKENGVNVEQGNRKILDGKEIDIFLPDYNIGIEYDGLKWHSDEFCVDRYYHLNKTIDCAKKNVKLIHIFEDEYFFHKRIVLSKIEHLLHIDKNLEKINARQCNIKEIDKNTARFFLEKNHIQGFAKSTVYIGCFYKHKLVGVMTFLKEKENDWELNRFASDINCICRGVAGKLLSFFKKNYKWDKIKSFADKRWVTDENDNLYLKLGFKLDKVLKPDYRYVVGKKRIHKFNFRKHILNKKYGFPLSMTESEMAKQLGCHKIWDCGLIKYVCKNENPF